MIIDTRLQLSAQQALTATAASTNIIDLGPPPFAVFNRLIGPGEPLWLAIAVRVALAGTSPTFAASLQTDTTSAFGATTTLLTSQTFTALAAGTLIVLPMTFTNQRFLRANYTLGGTTPTITVDSWLTNQDPTAWSSMPDALAP